MNENVQLAVVALLPLTALITVLQGRPYYALISRGIMGAVAALIYAMLGAPDVALTEALIGTLLTILLYAVTVRSSMVLRIGWIPESDLSAASGDPSCDPTYAPLQRFCRHYDLTPKFFHFEERKTLLQALYSGRIDAVYLSGDLLQSHLPEYVPSPTTADRNRTLFLAKHTASLAQKMASFFREENFEICRITGKNREVK